MEHTRQGPHNPRFQRTRDTVRRADSIGMLACGGGGYLDGRDVGDPPLPPGADVEPRQVGVVVGGGLDGGVGGIPTHRNRASSKPSSCRPGTRSPPHRWGRAIPNRLGWKGLPGRPPSLPHP